MHKLNRTSLRSFLCYHRWYRRSIFQLGSSSSSVARWGLAYLTRRRSQTQPDKRGARVRCAPSFAILGENPNSARFERTLSSSASSPAKTQGKNVGNRASPILCSRQYCICLRASHLSLHSSPPGFWTFQRRSRAASLVRGSGLRG